MNKRILFVLCIAASILLSCSKDQLSEMHYKKRIIGEWVLEDRLKVSSSHGEPLGERISYRFKEDGTFSGEYLAAKILHESLLLTTETTYTGRFELVNESTALNLMEEGSDPVLFKILSLTDDALTLEDREGRTTSYVKQADE